ncbi:MAG: hypothetical protein KDI13_01190 [Alphaproteobacteria bacterium]|nr:hypothetical protein [Alphaproteobacteria bacterium]
MSTIAGASQYLTQATLANVQGYTTSSTNLLVESGASAVSLLDVGRSLNSIGGLGLSTNARILNKQLLDKNNGTFNTLFSAGLDSGGSTVESAITIINSLRSTLPQDQVHESVRGITIDTST